jgi:shikimate dehydrogenase
MTSLVRAAVLGHPVAHSKSPLIHNHWIKKYGLEGTYEALDVEPGNFVQQIRFLAAQGYKGFSLTLPHKTAALAVCDEFDDIARAVGAVNTVTVRDGRLCGANTDVFGFLENIRTAQAGFDFKAGPAVVLGAGGAARAVIHGLLQEGVPEVRLLNRTRANAETLKSQSTDPAKISVIDWAQRGKALAGAALLANTTALGMTGQEELRLDLDFLPATALVNDIVYAPLYTDLLRSAQARGNPVVTGIGMLLHQARPAFKSWFGVMPDVDAALERIVTS